MRFSFPRLVLCGMCLLSGNLSGIAHAFERREMPMGDYIRASPLIVIGDISTSDAPKYEQVVNVREVVRGDSRPGERIVIPPGDTTRYIVPQQAQNTAVLFSPDWQKNSSPVEEVYQRPDELMAVRTLVRIYGLPTERAQLLALQERSQEANPLFATQLIADFAQMRQSQNFDIVLSSFPRLDVAHQETLVRLLGRIGDERSLPLLIAALQSPHREVSSNAANVLAFDFPGAPGVTEAFRSLAQNPTTHDSSLSYLAKHDPVFAATLPETAPTPWQQVRAKLKDGDTVAARDLLFATIEGEKQANWNTLFAAQELLPLLDDAGKTRLRLLMAGYLEHGDLDYLQAKSAITLLRALPAPDNTTALIHLLHDAKDSPYTPWGDAARAATFALIDLGPAAKQSATARVLEKIKTRLIPTVQTNTNEETLYFCQLVWLADDATWQKTIAELPSNLSSQMKALQPLRDAATSKNEAAALVALLPDTRNRWQNDSNRWIIARLDDLHAPVAIAPLIAELAHNRFNGTSSDIETALIAIGGPLVEAECLKLLRSDDDGLRRSGMDILRALQGEKMRPLLHRMLTEPNFGDQEHAIFLLGYVGTPADLPLLSPFADFWTGDRLLQSTATSAVAAIRDRCGYDVHGPIAERKTT